VRRILCIVALSAVLAGCQGSTKAAATPSPRPSAHTPVTAAVLQQSEIPAGLGLCPGAGPMAGYLTTLAKTDPDLATTITQRWQRLRSEGAIDGAISIAADGSAACTSELGVTPTFKAVATFVAVFGDEGQAERAWESGVLGFVPPASDEVAPGLVRGTSTGLGVNAWTYNRPSVELACWRRSAYVSLVVLANLDPVAFKAVTAAINARLN
jgi:hypothetical protein